MGFPGKLYNKPDPKGPGVDVYAGCNIDYRGKTVTPATFKDVLLGTGAGKVLGSDEESFVHISFFDHGAAGLIAFPKGTLHKNELQSILQQMSDEKKFKKLVFYLETCESGSMFEGMNISDIYALSAASPTESSWGTYCGSEAKVNGKSIGSCLGDLFSVSWMEDTRPGHDEGGPADAVHHRAGLDHEEQGHAVGRLVFHRRLRLRVRRRPDP